MSETQTNEYTVTGMTCGHCVASVTEEVQEIAGVTDVQVDLATGSLRFTSDSPSPTPMSRRRRRGRLPARMNAPTRVVGFLARAGAGLRLA